MEKKIRDQVLRIRHLKIRAGEKIAILGRNGAGKSTLLQLLSGMQVPTQGAVHLDGLDLSLIDPSDVRRRYGATQPECTFILRNNP